MQAFPKIFHLGDKSIVNITDGPVEITEKIDGSQFVFGVKDGGLLIRSKGAMIYDKDHFVREIKPSDIFYPAVQYVMELYGKGILCDNWTYFSETLCKPRHSTLKYNKVPYNNITLFGALNQDGEPIDFRYLKDVSDDLAVDHVPLLYLGLTTTEELNRRIEDLLKEESYLGGPKIEGVVVKRYEPYFVGGQLFPIMAGKYVSEEFKEVHKSNWNRNNTGKGKWDTYKAGFRTEARWNKAVQYLRDCGELTESPKDIGALIKRVGQDIEEEHKEEIKKFLWKEFGKGLIKHSYYGLPEWYKKQLMTGE